MYPACAVGDSTGRPRTCRILRQTVAKKSSRLRPISVPDATEHVKLTCAYYPKFMVKELNDPGLKGALITFLPNGPGGASGCTRRRRSEEKVFDWPGYYGGVKRDLIFLVDADDTDGLGFGIFDSKTGAKVFEDVVSISHDQLDFVRNANSQTTLRYLRVVTGDCSLPEDGNTCWSKFKEKTGLRLAPMPSCDYHGEDVRDPSVIEYSVELSLFPKPVVKALASPNKCRPSN
jgi:hypothetical protein